MKLFSVAKDTSTFPGSLPIKYSFFLAPNIVFVASNVNMAPTHFQVGEGRALYNLGNVFHAKGKHLGRLGQQDPGEFPEDVRNCLLTAVNYYE